MYQSITGLGSCLAQWIWHNFLICSHRQRYSWNQCQLWSVARRKAPTLLVASAQSSLKVAQRQPTYLLCNTLVPPAEVRNGEPTKSFFETQCLIEWAQVVHELEKGFLLLKFCKDHWKAEVLFSVVIQNFQSALISNTLAICLSSKQLC